MPTVHVITIHHRGKTMLQECLRSLLASTGVDLEIVVVANHCQEELPPIIEQEAQIHLWVAPRNLGFSEANNAGVRWAREHLGTADYYYFINNDTCSSTTALGQLVEVCESESEVAATGPQLRIWGAPDHLNSLGLNVTDDAWGWDEGIGIAVADYGEIPPRRDVAALTGSALLLRADVFADIGGWTEIYQYYFEDIDLCLKTWKAGRRVVHVPEAIVLHQISATMSVGSDWKLFLFWRNRLLLAIIHWPLDLLWGLAKRALVDEIWRRPRSENGLQRRAMWGALRRLPGLLYRRWRHRGDDTWRRFLVPAGSGPVITLPETRDPFAADTADDTAGAAVEGAGGEPPPGSAEETVHGEAWSRAAACYRQSLEGPPVPVEASGDPPRRVLVLGWGPLPFEPARMNYAPGARSWQLAAPLAAAGHRVVLAIAAMPGAYDDPQQAVAEEVRDGVLIYRLDREAFEQGPALPQLMTAFQPQVLVGAAAQPSRRAAQLAADLPLWVDLFGDPMAEAQAKSAAHATGDHLTAYWRMLADLLERGDAFAAVSERQTWAAVGQLGLAGRLNRQNLGPDLVPLDLVHTVPCAVPVVETTAGSEVAATAAGSEVAATMAGPSADDFVVLWSGGFNTWCDVETLCAALDAAMDRCPQLVFVATGGSIAGQDETTYSTLQNWLERTPHAARCRLLGCLPAAEARAWLARADLGLVTERPLYERRLGSSGRLLEWLGNGLPFICTELSEIASQLAAKGWVRTYPAGDAKSLAEQLVAAFEHRREGVEQAAAAAAWARQELTATATTRPLRRFVAAARRAPDAQRLEHHYLAAGEDLVFQAELDAAKRQLAEQSARAERFEALYHGVRSELGAVHQSKMWKLWMAYLAPRQWLKGRIAKR